MNYYNKRKLQDYIQMLNHAAAVTRFPFVIRISLTNEHRLVRSALSHHYYCLNTSLLKATTLQFLNTGTDESEKTVQALIRLHQGQHFLQFHMHLLTALLQCTTKLSHFWTWLLVLVFYLMCPSFKSYFTVHSSFSLVQQ